MNKYYILEHPQNRGENRGFQGLIFCFEMFSEIVASCRLNRLTKEIFSEKSTMKKLLYKKHHFYTFLKYAIHYLVVRNLIARSMLSLELPQSASLPVLR